MLKEAGYEAAANSRELVVQDLENDVEFFFLRPRDIAVYVGSGTIDVGITGTDPGILRTWLDDNKITADIVKLDGAVENAVALGVADLVADVVATGTTLRQAGLEVIGEPIFRSQALLVCQPKVENDPRVTVFVRRLQGVIVARSYVLVDYDIPNDLVEKACAITPGIESPTVSPLQNSSWSAVRAMVPRKNVHTIMDDLYEIGARGVLVTDIHACRL